MTLEQPQEKPKNEEFEKLREQFEASKSSIPLTEAEIEALEESDKDDHLYGRK
jgi:hypothetical protein